MVYPIVIQVANVSCHLTVNQSPTPANNFACEQKFARMTVQISTLIINGRYYSKCIDTYLCHYLEIASNSEGKSWHGSFISPPAALSAIDRSMKCPPVHSQLIFRKLGYGVVMGSRFILFGSLVYF